MSPDDSRVKLCLSFGGPSNNDPPNNGSPSPSKPPKLAPSKLRRLVFKAGIEPVLSSYFGTINPDQLSHREWGDVQEAARRGVLREDEGGYFHFTDFGEQLRNLYRQDRYSVSFTVVVERPARGSWSFRSASRRCGSGEVRA